MSEFKEQHAKVAGMQSAMASGNLKSGSVYCFSYHKPIFTLYQNFGFDGWRGIVRFRRTIFENPFFRQTPWKQQKQEKVNYLGSVWVIMGMQNRNVHVCIPSGIARGHERRGDTGGDQGWESMFGCIGGVTG